MNEEKSMEKYYCINCGERSSGLFKRYSATVLKLTECKHCKLIADKYVEFDIVIIIIDLVLLNAMAYRHILLNTHFKHFWKLSVILILLESFYSWTFQSNVNSCKRMGNKTEASLNDYDVNIEDLRFYITCLTMIFGYACFITSIYCWTLLYEKYSKNGLNIPVSFVLIWKMVTLASSGIFLHLPSIIWDISLYNYHLHFITLYTWLSQLIAYRVVCQAPKAWCLLVIFSSHFIKTTVSIHLSDILNNYLLPK